MGPGGRWPLYKVLPALSITAWACAASPGPQLPAIVSVSGLRPVAVYRFVDGRGEDEHVVGYVFFHGRSGVGPYDPPPDSIRTSEAVDLTVTRAFAKALKARGFPIVDRTDTRLAPREVPPSAQIAVSGEITRYRVESHVTVSGMFTSFADRAECRVVLRAHQLPSGDLLWERTYTAAGGGSGGLGSPDALAYALARAANDAVNDPDLLAKLGGRAD